MKKPCIEKVNIPGLELYARGKVRDTFEVSKERLLIVATDRISAFDRVVGAIPGRGKILNRMSEFWFEFFRSLAGNHMISTDLSYAHNHSVWLWAEQNDLAGRSMIVHKAERIPVECVVRGYLSGSGWESYQQSGQICGIKLPPGLRESEKLPENIFTPTTKAEVGHDQPLTQDELIASLVGWRKNSKPKTYYDPHELAAALYDFSLAIYHDAAAHALERGIIIADTKFEFGILEGEIVLIDELLTPDSSRFWPLDDYKPGRPQKSFDKQFLRDWLSKVAKWDKKSSPPKLPPEIVKQTSLKYEEALKMLL